MKVMGYDDITQVHDTLSPSSEPLTITSDTPWSTASAEVATDEEKENTPTIAKKRYRDNAQTMALKEAINLIASEEDTRLHVIDISHPSRLTATLTPKTPCQRRCQFFRCQTGVSISEK